jgi:hypothetical protein
VGLKSKLLAGGIQVYNGTPRLPLAAPALFLRVARVRATAQRSYTIASLHLARPGSNGYLIKELISDMQLAPEAAVEKAVDIALRGDVHVIYLNANLDRLPMPVPNAG